MGNYNRGNQNVEMAMSEENKEDQVSERCYQAIEEFLIDKVESNKASWELLPQELREHYLRQAAKVGSLMWHFSVTDSDYYRKETIIIQRVKEKLLEKYPPDKWEDLIKSLYLSLTAERN